MPFFSAHAHQACLNRDTEQPLPPTYIIQHVGLTHLTPTLLLPLRSASASARAPASLGLTGLTPHRDGPLWPRATFIIFRSPTLTS